ncbi:cytoplasmic protein [Coprinellus micaceus]|uniref:Cytoplasmic protein n=1 Tax=Coprinellus micaceus TaxID=71717 RepID=A0A4Y7TPJ0_COPMI|nr:cytoplasmic protein [Coprinellus micaceus]
MADTLTSQTLPKTSATLTVRIIKSFTYRTEKSLVLHDVNLVETTVGQLKERAGQAVQTQPGWKPYKNVQLDTMKLYTKAHGAKTQNLIINLDHDDWILSDEQMTLEDLGFENETEVSFFNRADYDAFKQNPETSWAC